MQGTFGGGKVMGAQSKCGALTGKGRRCQNLAMVGASRCHLHRGDWSKYTIEKRKAKARKRRKR